MRTLILSLGLALAAGCASAPKTAPDSGWREPAPPAGVIYPADGEGFRMEDWVRDHPMPSGQEFSLYDVSRSESSSTHIVQVRQAEALHVHEYHDLVVIGQKGYGVLRVGSRPLRFSPGSVVLIPRGTPHSFVNESPEPAVVFVVFTPPFDGKDTVPIAE